ncbi:MAG TPA: GAF domain-containing protein [Anaerolineaceae bacterium]
MSKKPLQNRLDNLFKKIQSAEPVLTEQPPAVAAGWYWECTPEGVYLTCSAEVQEYLGVPADSFVGQPVEHFQLHPDFAGVVRSAFRKPQPPREAEVFFIHADQGLIPARINILTETGKNGHASRWQGFVQVLPQGDLPAPAPARPPLEMAKPAEKKTSATGPLSVTGIALEAGAIRPNNTLWTRAGIQSLSQNDVIAHSGGNGPAAIAAPVRLRDRGTGILEIVDDEQRAWTEDERALVQEVANQLALALENAELYQTVQQELGERIRAEQEILSRNQDLATLNQAGQQLSRLTAPQEIYNLVSSIVSRMMGCKDLAIAQFDNTQRTVTYPVTLSRGETLEPAPAQPLGNDVAGYLYWTKKPLLLGSSIESQMFDLGITLPEPIPQSLLAIPMLAGDRAVGALILQDFDKENAYTNIHVELLSTLTSQATTALENANLFQEIRAALAAIENRERYQANVALVAATLSKYGSKSLSDVLASLGEASQVGRVYFAEASETDGKSFWRPTGQWIAPDCGVSGQFPSTQITPDILPYISEQLRETGWVAKHVSDLPSPDREFFTPQNVRSVLVLPVVGRGRMPSFVAFEQFDRQRDWQLEEVRVLQIATDALSNTILRENLLKQVQVSLHETENLYNLSHNLALANDPTEMLTSIATGIQPVQLQRASLVTFGYTNRGGLTGIHTSTTWSAGSEQAENRAYSLNDFRDLFVRATPAYFDDLADPALNNAARAVFDQDGTRSLGMLPLWAGKRQIGVLLLESQDKNAFGDQVRRTLPPLADQLATSLDNLRLFTETQNALAETGQMYKVSEAVSQAKTAQDLVMVIANGLMPTGTDRITLAQITYTPDGEPLEVEMIGRYDIDGDYQSIGNRYRASLLPFFTSVTNEPLIVPDVREYKDIDPVSLSMLVSSGAIGMSIVPLVASGRTIGIIGVSAKRPLEFNPDEVRSLQAAANGIAISLEKQRLLAEAQRRALELQTAAEIARDTTSTLSLDQLLHSIVNTMRDRFNFYHASIFLLDSNRKYAVIRESTGEAGREMKARNHKLSVGSRSVIGTVTASGEPLIISETAKSPLHYPNPLLPETRAEMGIPLKLGKEVIGALDLQSDVANAFNQDDLAVLQILADQIAIAIENARAYEISQKAVEEMREVDRMKSQFLANMSHELRTPLNSIIGFSRVILKGIDGPINDTQSQDLNAIYNSGQHLLSLINDILDLSKIEAGKMELSFSEVNLSEMANSVMSTAIGLVKGKPVRLNQDISADLPLVRADNTRVRQVLLNFISNAAKFTEDGSITVNADIIESPTGISEVMVTVTDTGAGIAPEDTHKLFQPFSQVDDSPTRKTGGTGLGLSICRSLIEMHGGRIGLLRSEVGVGSTFFFTLPLAVPEPEPEPEIIPEGAKTILAIDDDIQVISLYERYLKPHGYVVLALTDPKLAVQRAKEIQPSAITVDIMMPERDGWQVMRELKNDPETRSIPIIICSILEEEEKGFNLGAADYLVKPFAQDDLFSAISRLDSDGTAHEVLVVDDSAIDARLVQKMLEDSGSFQVRIAANGEEGWNSIISARPDIVILDLFMPGLNGFDLLERLRADQDLRSIPVIILTGADLTAEQQTQLAQFGQQMLAKGHLSEKDLLASLEMSLKKYHLIDE